MTDHSKKPANIEELRRLKMAKKEAKKLQSMAQNQKQVIPPKLLEREFVAVPNQEPLKCILGSVRIMTFNILAQLLIKRELFPDSGDYLKWKIRRKMIVDEIKLYDADILTIQELDNFDEFYKQIFTELGYQVEYYCHPSKRHGCGIVYKKNKYTKVDYDTINYDLDTLCSPSVLTGNIGQLIALRLSDQPNTGFVIGNTHLYWRPSSNYERCRQTIIYANRLLEFRSQLAKDISWISFLNGDFNTTPDDPVYALLTTNEFTQDIVENLAESRLITLQKKDGLEEEEEKVESDRIIITEDVDTAEKLLAKYNKTKWTSIYSHFGKIGPPELVGLFGEPKFTDYASQFKGTLDYMFVDAPVIIKQLLTPPKEEYLKPSLPNKHFGSDHLCLIADIEFQ